MSCKTMVQEWRRAIDVLALSAVDFAGMEAETLPILKYSYDSLNGEVVKSCFLYCSLFPEDYLIQKEKLVDYWICEGFIDENEGRERAINQVYEIVGILVRACLLLEGVKENELCVSVHDVVREMALWIATDLGKHKDICIVQAGVGLCKVPKVKNWRDVKKMSLMRNSITNISGSPGCPELITLFLQENDTLVHLSKEFFKYMPKLAVLDLSGNRTLSELPKQISRLSSLRYLDLSATGVKQLQVGLQELKHLIYLNLEDTVRLEHISGISNLSNLRTLRLGRSTMKLDMTLLKELQLLEYLEFLTIEFNSGMVWEHFLSSHMLVKCLRNVCFQFLEELILPATCDLRTLSISNCKMREIKTERTSSSLNDSPTTSCFSNLSKIHISICSHLEDLTWLLFAPNLVDLKVESSNRLEEIISEEKAASVRRRHGGNIVPFQKLRCLYFYDLPVLKSIYWGPLSLPCLNKISIGVCPKLRKLPFDSERVVRDPGNREYYE